MRHAAVLAAVALVLAAARSGTAQVSATRGGGGASPLVVHEWGTFTSMQGADGGGLEGLQHEEERLPEFVYSRTEVRECPLRAYGYKGLEVPVTHVTQKMETPVIYFYTDVPRKARVRVDFDRGLISQWFPVSDLIGPPEASEDEGPLDLSRVARSFIQWDVELVPRSAPAPAGIPAVAASEPWSFARQVDAAYVRTLPRKRPERMGPTEAEHYLFYRGLGTFTMPVTAKAVPGGAGTLANDGDAPLQGVYALQVAGGLARFQRLGAVAARDSAPWSLGSEPFRPLDAAVSDLQTKLQADLVAAGLFEKEAVAMIATWTRSWFRTEGTRFFYVVPRSWTDRILPLHLDPAPDALVRVLVGRLELITPEVEREVASALADLASPENRVTQAAMTRLLALDRFLEPHLRRVLAAPGDSVAKREAAKLLETSVLDPAR